MHMASFKNESQIVLAFCDFDLQKKKMPLLHVMYFEVRKPSFSFIPDINYSDSFTPPSNFSLH